MSVFKFACPVCGQHIQCDSIKSGSPMECPTCFRQIVVPQAPAGADSKLLLTAAEVQSRPRPKFPVAEDPPGQRASSIRPTLAFALALVVVAGAAAGAAYVFRDQLFKHRDPKVAANSIATPRQTCLDTNWTLKLADRKIPESRAAGRINGHDFVVERASVQGGVLSFRQGARTPKEVGLTIHLFARQGEDLAGQSLNIEASRTNAPKVVMRSKIDPSPPVTQTVREGYALRMEFGPVTGGRLPGKFYLCMPDAEQSWVSGTFEAEIRKPSAPRPPVTPRPAPPTVARP